MTRLEYIDYLYNLFKEHTKTLNNSKIQSLLYLDMVLYMTYNRIHRDYDEDIAELYITRLQIILDNLEIKYNNGTN